MKISFDLKKTFMPKRFDPGQRKVLRDAKSYLCIFIALGLIGSGLFVYMWPRVKLVTLVYDYNAMKEKKKELTHYNRMLRLELASIKSLDRVEKIATEKMGMIVPADEDIVLIKVRNEQGKKN